MSPAGRRLDLFFSGAVALTAWQLYYGRGAESGIPYLQAVVLSADDRPFVYRVLVPLLSRTLSSMTGVDALLCMIALIVASSIGLYFSLTFLIGAFRPADTWTRLLALATSEMVFLLMAIFPKVYDIPTAMFFALSFALLARGRFGAYLLLFPLITLNRETSFLLTAVWLVVSHAQLTRRAWILGTLYQGAVYLLVRIMVMSAFADRPGALLVWRPLENFHTYQDNPLGTGILLVTLSLLLWRILQHWPGKPTFLRTAFSVLFPLQIILHLALGYPWEFRVYLESVPLIGLLALWKQ